MLKAVLRTLPTILLLISFSLGSNASFGQNDDDTISRDSQWAIWNIMPMSYRGLATIATESAA